MKYLTTGLVTIGMALGSCQQSPDQVRIFKDPSGQYQYLVSDYYGAGAISSDYTRIFVKALGDDDGPPILVAGGAYLNISRVKFAGGYSAVFCQAGGRLDQYHPIVKMEVRGVLIPVRSTIERNCL